MSISSSDRIAGPFSSGTVLPFGFKVFQTSDVRVVKTLVDGTVLPDLAAPTDYSVSLNADQDVNPGGEVTLTAAISGGDSVVVTSVVPNTQPTTITNLGGFLPSTLNTAFDRGVIQTQQVASKVEASIQFPVSDANANNPVLPPAAVRANKYLAFDAVGDPLVTDGAPDGVPVSGYGETLVQATDSADARSILEIAQVPFTAASASASASLRFAEDTDNGSNYLDLTAPASLSFSATCILPFAGGNLVAEDNNVTLSNKKLQDSTVTFADNSDATKQLAFQCSGIATGTTRTLTVPDASGTIALAHIPVTNSLSADVALNNTANYFDGPTIAQGTSGTWFAFGTVLIECTTGGGGLNNKVNVKLWDGTTVIASTGSFSVSDGSRVPVALSGYLASPAGDIRISVQNETSTAGKILYNYSGNSKDSTISAFRIGQ